MNAFPVLFDRKVTLNLKGASLIFVLVAATNIITYMMMNFGNKATNPTEAAAVGETTFYLSDQAAKHIDDLGSFEQKVRRISRQLTIPPEWLMTVIYFESRFDPTAVNAKGSGATGLLQWKREEAELIGATPEKIKNMDAIEQLDLIADYLKAVKQQQGSNFEDLTDLYLAAFYPQALGEDYCYAMFQSGEINYNRYAPLDFNTDGRITVKDIDDRLKEQFPTAYFKDKRSAERWWAWFGL